MRRKTSAFTSQTYTGGLEKREGSLNFRGMLLGDGAEEKKTGKGMSEEEQLDLLATDGMLVKRPLLVGDDFVLVGFREKEWEERLSAGAEKK